MEIDGKKCIPHKVKITEHFEGIIHIPEEMDAMDLKSLTMEANHIFKMSQACMPEDKTEEVNIPTPTPTPTPMTVGGNAIGRGIGWTKEETDRLKELYQTKTPKEISKIMNIDIKRIWAKVCYLNKLKKMKKGRVNSTWTEEEEKTLKRLHKQGKTTPEIAKEMNRKYMQIYHKQGRMNLKPNIDTEQYE